jgi:protein-tyrosine phosphatase
MNLTKVLFVCMGNICRSPTAEGVFIRLLKEQGLENHFHIDSAGTHAYHVGEAPDSRAQEAAKKRGINLAQLKGRQVVANDFMEFDYVLAMPMISWSSITCWLWIMTTMIICSTFAPRIMNHA